MRELPIAYGNSSHARFWSNKTTTWNDLCERLRNTVRTTETVDEYRKMSKADREAAKDRGGFVAGHLRDNRRKAETVACRSILALDGDKLEKGFFDRFKAECPCQTFPQDYDFMDQNVQYVCGMSVPPVMMARIAEQVYRQWLAR